MNTCDVLIRNAVLIDGSGGPESRGDLAIRDGLIVAVGELPEWRAATVMQANGQVLCPGFIDAHTHDDTQVIRNPQMWPKLSQGVTTVIVGNCGISAAPVTLTDAPPDPLNLLGPAEAFTYPHLQRLRRGDRRCRTGSECRRAGRTHRTAPESDGSP